MPGQAPDDIFMLPQPFIVKGPHLYSYFPTYDLEDTIEAEYFAYQFPVMGPFTAGLTAQSQVQIQANTAFEMRDIVYFWNLNNGAFTSGAQPIPNATLQLQDSGSGKNLFSAPAPISSVARVGGDQRPAQIWPRIFAPNATIQATVTNFDAAVINGLLRLTLIGRHLYRLARPKGIAVI